MQYTVVHSKDPYLLARLATDLQMEGLSDKLLLEYQSIGWNPFDKKEFQWLRISSEGLLFMSHKGTGLVPRHELTSRNYIKVLTQILEP